MKNLFLLMAVILVTACQQTAEPTVETTAEPVGPHTSIEWRVWAYSTAAVVSTVGSAVGSTVC